MIGGPALQRQRLKEYLPADLCHHGRTAAVEVLWVVWRPLNEPWGLRFVWVSEIEHLGIPFFMPFFLDLEFFHLFWEEDAWMRACACCPKRMTLLGAHAQKNFVSMSIYESTFCPAHSSRSQKNPTVCRQRSMDSQWARSHHQDRSCVERVRCLTRSVPYPFAENRTCGCWTEPGWIYESATFPEEEWRSNFDTFCWTVESLKSPILEYVT